MAKRVTTETWFKPRELEVAPVVAAYNKSAACIFVLTGDEFFGGDRDDLIRAKVVTDIPVLCRDFIMDTWQVAESRAFGAVVILLIAVFGGYTGYNRKQYQPCVYNGSFVPARVP